MSHFSEAIAAFERGNFARAIELFDAALGEGDSIALARSKRGVCHLHLGDREAAERDFRDALSTDEHCVSAMVNLGNMMLEEGRLDDAQVYYERALRIDETYAVAHYNLGVLLRKRGSLAASIRELRLAAKYEAKPENARKRLAWWKR